MSPTDASPTPDQFKSTKNMHSTTMGKTAMATSGSLHKDETHRGEEARTYLRSSFFVCIPQLLTGYLQMVWLKSIKGDGRSAGPAVLAAVLDLGSLLVHERQHECTRFRRYTPYMLKAGNTRLRTDSDRWEQVGR